MLELLGYEVHNVSVDLVLQALAGFEAVLCVFDVHINALVNLITVALNVTQESLIKTKLF